jgi:hypothetical protein
MSSQYNLRSRNKRTPTPSLPNSPPKKPSPPKQPSPIQNQLQKLSPLTTSSQQFKPSSNSPQSHIVPSIPSTINNQNVTPATGISPPSAGITPPLSPKTPKKKSPVISFKQNLKPRSNSPQAARNKSSSPQAARNKSSSPQAARNKSSSHQAARNKSSSSSSKSANNNVNSPSIPAVSSSSSPSTIPKIVFSNRGSTSILNKKYNKLSIDDCKYLIKDLKVILKDLKNNPNGNKKVKHPSQLVYNGYTVKQLLSKCYAEHNTIQNDILKIMDKKDIIDNLNTSAPSAPSPSATTATAAPVAKTKTSPNPKPSTNIDFTEVLDDLINNKITIDDVLNNTTYLKNNISLKNLLNDYKISCENINKSNIIDFNDYINHTLNKLVYILYIVIYSIINNIKISKLDISFILFDDYTLEEFNKIYPVGSKCEKIYNLCNPIYTKMNINNRNTNVYNDLDKNTILNRTIKISFLCKNKNIYLDANNTGFISLSYLITNDIRTFKNSFKEFINIFNKYNTIFPKYHFINVINSNLKNNDNLIINNDLKYIMTILYYCSYNLNKNYDIQQSTNPYDNILIELKNYHTDEHYKKKLLYVLINNSVINKPSGEYYYYYFKFDGPFSSMSPLNYKDFLNLKQYQPFNITNTIFIEGAYKGTAPLFSKDLNQGLQQFILNDIPLGNNVKDRLIKMFEFTKYNINPSYNPDDIFVFHGTRNIIHSQNDTEINLLSFLSCSFNIYIAFDYALGLSGSLNNSGVVYIFKIDKTIEYINFNDSLYQIILPPGAKILINKEISISNIKYVFCEVKNTNKGKQYYIDLFNSIKKNGSNPLYKITSYYITNANIYNNPIIIYEYPICVHSPTPFNRQLFRQNVPYIYKDVTDDIIYTSLGTVLNGSDINSFFNIQYTIHQLIINDCYYKFNYNCIGYFLYYNDTQKEIYTGWKYDPNYGTTIGKQFIYNIDNYFMDCLISNVDFMNDRNYLQHIKNKDNKLVWFKGCGLYNINGIKKINFKVNEEPTEHITFLLTCTEAKNKFKTKTILEPTYNKFLNSITSFKDFLNLTLKPRYIIFLKKYITGLIDPATQQPTQEYKDLEKMINELIDTLLYRIDYYINNKKNIIKMISTYCKNTVTGGGETSLQPYNIRDNILHFKKQNVNKTNLTNSSDISYIDKFKLSYNNNIIIDDFVHIINKKKPLLEYNDVKNDPVGNEPYDAYFVSNKEFDLIAKKMNIKANGNMKAVTV